MKTISERLESAFVVHVAAVGTAVPMLFNNAEKFSMIQLLRTTFYSVRCND